MVLKIFSKLFGHIILFHFHPPPTKTRANFTLLYKSKILKITEEKVYILVLQIQEIQFLFINSNRHALFILF